MRTERDIGRRLEARLGQYVEVHRICAWCGRLIERSLEHRDDWSGDEAVIETHGICAPPCRQAKEALGL